MALGFEDDRRESDSRVDQATMDECESALDAVEEGKEALRVLARKVLAEIHARRPELIDRQDYTCRSNTRPIEIIEACENLADEVAAALEGALLNGELRRARTIIETGRDD